MLGRRLSRATLRWYLIAILTMLALFGASTSRALRAAGMQGLVTRNFIVLVVSYGVFFLLMHGWLRFLSSSPSRLRGIAAHAVANTRPAKERILSSRRGERSSSWWDVVNLPDFANGAVLYLIFVAAAGLIVGWVLIEGPTVLIDAAFEVSLSVGLLQASRKAESGGWAGGVLKRTLLPFCVVLLLSTFILWGAEVRCPGVDRLSQVLISCPAK